MACRTSFHRNRMTVHGYYDDNGAWDWYGHFDGDNWVWNGYWGDDGKFHFFE